MSETKSYVIPKQLVWESYQRVKANRDAAGVDGESLAAFEKDLPWVRRYVARWLCLALQRPDGILEERTKGTPQGGVVSPVLAARRPAAARGLT